MPEQPAEPMVPTLVRVPPDMLTHMRRLADEGDRSLSAEFRRAVRLYLQGRAEQ